MVKKSSKSQSIVPDTSALISGKISEYITEGKIKGKIIILEAVLSELENQANKGRTVGFEGLEEIKKLREFAIDGKITLDFTGERPTPEEIKSAKYGAIDAKIREVATSTNSKLITGDYVQFLTAQARGIECEHFDTSIGKMPKIKDYFDHETMSVHLKTGIIPFAKKGKPGAVDLVKIGKKPSEQDELEELAREIIDFGRDNKSIELNYKGATVVQMENIRIAIAEPPFSMDLEITAVRPVAKVTLNDYVMSDKLKERLKDRAEGVLICGPPGAGKSSFAAALAEFYQEQGNIVKTMESPRDLQVNREITQYAPLEGSMEKTSDILLLVRPDYTIYDEVRKTRDFQIFADMRLAGVGMIGVTHASTPLDAIQRLISRMELGQIPLIIDTIVYIKDAQIRKVYQTKMTVKTPSGMMEADLARPVVEVMDFETGTVEHEIYTFGEQTIIMDAQAAPKSYYAEVQERKNEYVFIFDNDLRNTDVNIYAGSYYLIKARFGHTTEFRVTKKGKMGKRIERAFKYGDPIRGVKA